MSSLEQSLRRKRTAASYHPLRSQPVRTRTLFDSYGKRYWAGCALTDYQKVVLKNARVDERTEKHVTADAGEAVEIGDPHVAIVSRA